MLNTGKDTVDDLLLRSYFLAVVITSVNKWWLGSAFGKLKDLLIQLHGWKENYFAGNFTSSCNSRDCFCKRPVPAQMELYQDLHQQNWSYAEVTLLGKLKKGTAQGICNILLCASEATAVKQKLRDCLAC